VEEEAQPTKEKMDEKEAQHDYALLYLNEEVDMPQYIGLVCSYTEPNNDIMRLCGYPGKDYNMVEFTRDHTDAAFPYEVNAEFLRLTKETLAVAQRSYGGMSGSPFRVKDPLDINNEWKAVAILSGGSGPLKKSPESVGCRITREKLSLIRVWKEVLSGEWPEDPQALQALEVANLAGFRNIKVIEPKGIRDVVKDKIDVLAETKRSFLERLKTKRR
jgi:hypothetical protein